MNTPGGAVCIGIAVIAVLAVLFVLWCCVDVGARADDWTEKG